MDQRLMTAFEGLAAVAPSVACFHLALDPLFAHRRPDRLDEVVMRGTLLLDTGDCEQVEAVMPLDLFFRMQALAFLAVAQQLIEPIPGASVALTGNSFVAEGQRAGAAEDGVGIVRLHGLVGLDRLAVEAEGPRFLRNYAADCLLPKVRRHAA